MSLKNELSQTILPILRDPSALKPFLFLQAFIWAFIALISFVEGTLLPFLFMGLMWIHQSAKDIEVSRKKTPIMFSLLWLISVLAIAGFCASLFV